MAQKKIIKLKPEELKNVKKVDKNKFIKVLDMDGIDKDQWRFIGHRTVVKKGERPEEILRSEFLD